MGKNLRGTTACLCRAMTRSCWFDYGCPQRKGLVVHEEEGGWSGRLVLPGIRGKGAAAGGIYQYILLLARIAGNDANFRKMNNKLPIRFARGKRCQNAFLTL